LDKGREQKPRDACEHPADQPGKRLDPPDPHAEHFGKLAIVGQGTHSCSRLGEAQVDAGAGCDRDRQSQSEHLRCSDMNISEVESRGVRRQRECPWVVGPVPVERAKERQRETQACDRFDFGASGGQVGTEQRAIGQGDRRSRSNPDRVGLPVPHSALQELPAQQSAQRAERAVGEVEDARRAIQDEHPHPGERIERPYGEPGDDERLEHLPRSDLPG
jgi:hypothetical protein